MSFFQSDVVRSEMVEISELQEEVYSNVFKFPSMPKEEQYRHIDLLERLIEKQQIMYTRLSLSDDPEAKIMSPQEVLSAAREGEKKGCKELLFSMGEKPENRYVKPRRALEALGYETMTDYLTDMCKLVIANTSLLPHVNTGTLNEYEFMKLKNVSASMGMMLETTSKRLTKKGGPHYACPDKVPIQRIRTLITAGYCKVPFTTGILIGIGETLEERIEALLLLEKINKRYGHIQEVIVQNFQRKPDILMSEHAEPTLEEMLQTIALARIILSPSISIQAPPNLEKKHIELKKYLIYQIKK